MTSAKPKSDNAERENRILDAASRLIIHYGYDKTTMNDIATAANISKGAIYLHFDSKEILFKTLLEREIRDYSRAWIRQIRSQPNQGTFSALFQSSLKVLHRAPLMSALLRQDRRILGAYVRMQPQQFTQKLNSNVQLLTLMQQIGAVRNDVDPKTVAYILNMISYGLISVDEVATTETPPSIEAVIETLGRLLDRALMPEDGGNPEAAQQVIQHMITVIEQTLNLSPDDSTSTQEGDLS